MAKAWKDVIASQQYQALSPQQRAEAQEQYFNDVVAPQAGESVNEAKQQFYTAYPVETVQQEQQPVPAQQPEAQQPEGFWANVKDMVTGESRMTPEIENLPSISDAPEMKSMTKDAAKVAWAQMMGNQQDQEIMLKNMGAKISYDVKGNAIVTLPADKRVVEMGWIPELAEMAERVAKESGGVVIDGENGEKIISLPERRYSLNKPGLSPEDVASGVATAASFTPAGRAGGLVSAGLRAAGTDALIQGTTSYMGGTDIDPFQVGLSGVLGTGGKAFENIVGAAARAIKGKMSPEAETLLRNAEQHNVDVMTSDVVPPKNSFQRQMQQAGEQSFAGTGQRRSIQESQREAMVGDMSQMIDREFGIYAPHILQSEVSSGLSRAKAAQGNIINEINGLMGDAPVVATRSVASIDEAIQKMSKSLNPDDAAIQTLSKLKDRLSSGESFSSLRELRTDLREAMQGSNLVMPSRSDAAYQKINSALTSDMNSAVGRTLGGDALNKLRGANNEYRRIARGVEKTGLKNAIEKGDVTPELINNIVYSKRPSDIARIYGMVNERGKNQLRSAYLTKALESAGGSPRSMTTQLDNMINQSGGQIFKTIFNPRQRKMIEGMQEVLEATSRASTANQVTQTGMSLITPSRVAGGLLTGGGTTLAEAGTGLIARMYESSPVRNMLLRLANTPKGSTAYDRLISKISQSVTAVSQGEKGK
ncbi:hypothetical protein [Morganella morganii]|uniref:hypothetical protein n=1 Tax=Morganella morganii TaxID=582 RepID=UPI003119A72E